MTGLVTNGSRLDVLLDGHADVLDWAALSVDSGDERTQAALGRGRGNHVERSIRLADHCRDVGVRVKLNTVVTDLNVAGTPDSGVVLVAAPLITSRAPALMESADA